VTLLKSLAAGVVALIGYAALMWIILWLELWWGNRGNDSGIGVIEGPGWPVVVGALLVFLSAFAWSFKHFSK
jgi:hypothetical protein